MYKLAAGKPLALSEMSVVPTPELLAKQPYVWFMGWDDLMIKANTEGKLKQTFSSPNVVSDRAGI
jgi:mannan endo-1,4-beta-mannosidase